MKANEIYKLFQDEFNLTVAPNRLADAQNILSKSAPRLSAYADYIVSQRELPELLRDEKKIKAALDELSKEVQPLLEKVKDLEVRDAHRVEGQDAASKFNDEFEADMFKLITKFEGKMNGIWSKYRVNINNKQFMFLRSSVADYKQLHSRRTNV